MRSLFGPRSVSEGRCSFVRKVLASVQTLRVENDVLFYEFVTKCKLEGHIFHGVLVYRLQELELVQDDGTVHADVRRIVLLGPTYKEKKESFGAPYPETAEVLMQ